MAVVYDLTVVKGLIRRKDRLEGPETSAQVGMVEKDMPGVQPHRGALANGDFERLPVRKPSDDLLDSDPGHGQNRAKDQYPTGQHVLTADATDQQQGKQD